MIGSEDLDQKDVEAVLKGVIRNILLSADYDEDELGKAMRGVGHRIASALEGLSDLAEAVPDEVGLAEVLHAGQEVLDKYTELDEANAHFEEMYAVLRRKVLVKAIAQ